MKHWYWILALILAVAAAILIGYKPVVDITQADVKVGVVGPFEGSNAHIGKMIMNSARLYFDRHPAQDFEVTLVPIDDKSNPADAVSALQGVAGDPKLIALVAFYNSSTALAGKPIIQEAKLPTLIYSASNPKVTDEAPYYFRLVPTDDNQAIGLSRYAAKLGAKRAAILYFADEYGKGLADGITARAASDGYEIVSTQSYDTTTTDFRPMLTVIKGTNPDVVFICGFVEKSIAILNQAVERGLNFKFIAGDGTFNEEQLLQGAGNNAEGLYVAAPYVFDESNERNRDFLEAYWRAYDHGGGRKKPASWTAFAYDACGILDEAFRAGKRDRASLHQYLKQKNTPARAYAGITGVTYFNPKGDAEKRQFRLAVVRNQQFVAAE